MISNLQNGNCPVGIGGQQRSVRQPCAPGARAMRPAGLSGATLPRAITRCGKRESKCTASPLSRSYVFARQRKRDFAGDDINPLFAFMAVVLASDALEGNRHPDWPQVEKVSRHAKVARRSTHRLHVGLLLICGRSSKAPRRPGSQHLRQRDTENLGQRQHCGDRRLAISRLQAAKETAWRVSCVPRGPPASIPSAAGAA